MKCADYENEIRRIARVDDVKPVPCENFQTQHELPKQRHAVLCEIACHPASFSRQPVAIDGDSLDNFKRGRCARSLWTNYSHFIAMPRQCAGFRPHSAIERYWEIFDDDKHPAAHRAIDPGLR